MPDYWLSIDEFSQQNNIDYNFGNFSMELFKRQISITIFFHFQILLCYLMDSFKRQTSIIKLEIDWLMFT